MPDLMLYYVMGMLITLLFTMVCVAGSEVKFSELVARCVATSIWWPLVVSAVFFWALWTGTKFLIKLFVTAMKG